MRFLRNSLRNLSGASVAEILKLPRRYSMEFGVFVDSYGSMG